VTAGRRRGDDDDDDDEEEEEEVGTGRPRAGPEQRART
jgi:hypothetical protein